MKILSIKRKTKTLQALYQEALDGMKASEVPTALVEKYFSNSSSLTNEELDTLTKRNIVVYSAPNDDHKLDGITLPLKTRVNTRFGIRETNGFYVTKAKTRILTTENSKIECTLTHKMFTSSEVWVASKDLKVGDLLVRNDGTFDKIVSVKDSNEEKLVMDICVPGDHEYYGNGLVSHNSIVANALSMNQAEMGYKTNMVPLEMSSKEMLSRSMSKVSGYSSIDIFLKRLTKAEKDDIYKKFRRTDRKIAAAGGRRTIFKPKEDLTIEELLSAIHSFNADTTIIDYLTLLKGADGDDQWRKLGQIARFGKIYAENHNKVIVLLAQINEEGKLRYSQAVKEHSSLAWTFVATKESKEKGYLNIETLKSRNQIAKPFVLGIDYSKMNVFDLKPEDQERLDQEPKAGPAAKGRRGSAAHKEGKAADYSPPDLTE